MDLKPLAHRSCPEVSRVHTSASLLPLAWSRPDQRLTLEVREHLPRLGDPTPLPKQLVCARPEQSV